MYVYMVWYVYGENLNVPCGIFFFLHVCVVYVGSSCCANGKKG